MTCSGIDYKVPVLILVLPSKCQSLSNANNEIISYSNEVNLDNYKFAYKSGDGTKREESGGFENDVWTVRGRVSWTSPEGKTFAYEYIADAKGYQQTAVTSFISEVSPEGPPDDIAPFSEDIDDDDDDDDDGFVTYALPKDTLKGLLGGANR